MSDLIRRQDALSCFHDWIDQRGDVHTADEMPEYQRIEQLPSAQLEHLTDDDFETIRIHLNALKEKLCNQRRWKEAEEYQRIIDRFMSFVSSQPEQTGKWNTYYHSDTDYSYSCNKCGYSAPYQMIGGEVIQKKWNFCPNCGCRMMKKGD